MKRALIVVLRLVAVARGRLRRVQSSKSTAPGLERVRRSPTARSPRSASAKKPVEITYWHAMTHCERGRDQEAHRRVQRVAIGRARDPVGGHELHRQLHPLQGRARYRQAARPLSRRGHRNADSRRQPGDAAGAGVPRCRPRRHVRLHPSHRRVLQPARRVAAACRSTTRTSSSTTTRRCSSGPDSTRTSRRRPSTSSKRRRARSSERCREVRHRDEDGLVAHRALAGQGRPHARRQRQRSHGTRRARDVQRRDRYGAVHLDRQDDAVRSSPRARVPPTSITTSRSGAARPR